MPKKILLADDSITIQKVVELTFSDGDYEVIATNNGAKAIEEIPKVMPDIILSDIIMPEKNGYEVCEWVKSHPEHRNIPVILLTGTFEPFDPDRAEKAGCDAVVTKPFESQSLIQKVEELIGGASAETEDEGYEEPPPTEMQHPVLPPEILPDEPESVFQDDSQGSDSPLPPVPGSPAPEPSPQQEATEEVSPPAAPAFELGEPAAEESRPFEGAESDRVPPPVQESAPFPAEEEEPKPQGDVFESEVPSESPEEAESKEDVATRMIPKMSMEEIQQLQQEQETESAAPSAEVPEESEAPPPAFQPPAPEEPAAEEAAESSPFDSPPASSDVEDSETKMIPKMSMEDIQHMQQQQEAASQEEPAPFGGDEAPSPESEVDLDTSTRMIPKASFGEMDRVQQEQAANEEPPEAPEAIEAPGLGVGAPSSFEETAAPNPFAAESEPEGTSPVDDESIPFTEAPAEPIPAPALPPEEPVSEEFTEAEAEPAAPAQVMPGELSEDQIDRIARRVVELISDKTIREIAWDVIPETAEMVVRERIRELESKEED